MTPQAGRDRRDGERGSVSVELVLVTPLLMVVLLVVVALGRLADAASSWRTLPTKLPAPPPWRAASVLPIPRPGVPRPRHSKKREPPAGAPASPSRPAA
ncbi:TadE/TadG family type IV pilus assembly protein [Streptomyces sp. Isolate_219]|uniref:TadE/TadG family type IV pilus assembly protein n=1 Tax=Streptomyces sp. Isolate_219 TaxID=2950110 RepID=UPI0029058462|nr:TadE/TadG family type IV pilus assembly protein [Streptomyces sp. Isolate_219]